LSLYKQINAAHATSQSTKPASLSTHATVATSTSVHQPASPGPGHGTPTTCRVRRACVSTNRRCRAATLQTRTFRSPIRVAVITPLRSQTRHRVFELNPPVHFNYSAYYDACATETEKPNKSVIGAHKA